MKLVSSYASNQARKEPEHYINAFFKHRLLSIFSNFKHGYLVIRENDQNTAFGCQTNTGPNASIIINQPRAYRSVLLGGVVGAGEAYIDGEWDTPDLVKVIRFFTANIESLQKMDHWTNKLGFVANKIYHFSRKNSITGSRENISAHYDLSNDFFELFLDPTMMYSAAIFNSKNDSLQQASINKLKHICDKLELKESDHLLEIGTGWGGMAIYAAQNYGCKVTTTTISEQQYKFAQNKIEQLGLSDQITLLLKDYRDLEGRYDKIVSIEMIEAVGHQYYGQFFSKCSDLLKEDGLMSIQAITVPGQRYHHAIKNVDFIKKYIFPGGCLPSHQVITRHIDQDTNMQILDTEEISHHYADTLKLWQRNFKRSLNEIKSLGFNDQFIRMWLYYLCYCEGGFRERVIGTAQFLFAKPNYRHH